MAHAKASVAADRFKPSALPVMAVIDTFDRVRAFTETLCAPLQTEDYVIQSMPDASPAKWHLAHVSWFFEAFVLGPAGIGYQSPDPRYAFLYNSYYNALGPRHSRARRGMISRPTVEETYAYRHTVDAAMREFIGGWDAAARARWEPIVTLGLHHEQQHQELILTDIKHVLAQNPLNPAYLEDIKENKKVFCGPPPPLRWLAFPEGLRSIGHTGEGFAYDNEGPRHREFIEGFELASRPVTSGEFLAFIEDGGYRRPELWLSDGWATVQAEGWQGPLYWSREDGHWRQMTLHGHCPVEPHEPVCHVSFYEAEAYSHWVGARLPGEAEWETAVENSPLGGNFGNFAEDGHFHPRPLTPATSPASPEGLSQMFGDVWEWTRSPYLPYPGYQPAAGAIGEYNGKFMCNQFVLRGGSCATSRTHIRPTYRNFFPPYARWQFTGIRLARDIK